MARQVRPTGRPAYTRPSYIRPKSVRRSLRMAMPASSRRLLTLLVGMIVAVIIGWYFTRITTISVLGTTRAQIVRTNTEHILQGHLFWGNLITLSTGGLGSQLLHADPQLKEASVHRAWPKGIVVTVSDKHPSLVWDTGGERYLVDADGTIIATVGGGVGVLPLVKDQTNLPTALGHKVVTEHFVGFVSTLVAGLPRQGIHIQALEVHETTYDLYASTDKNYQIIFDTTRDANDELADLKTVETTLATQKAAPTSYIDLRVAGKAYYK